MTCDRAVEAWVQRMLAAAPPATNDQRTRIAALLAANRARIQHRIGAAA